MKNTHDIFEAAARADSPASDGESERDDREAVLDANDDASSLGGTTLELGPRSPLVSSDGSEDERMPEVPSVPPMPTDSESSAEEEEPAGDSQRPGAWQSNAYLHYNALDKAKVVAPVQTLYEWVVDGKPSGADFRGTFNSEDLQYLTSILQHTFFLFSTAMCSDCCKKFGFRFEIWKFKLYPLS